MNARRFPGLAAAVVFTLTLGFGWVSGGNPEADAPAVPDRVPQVPSLLTLDAALALALDFSPDLADASWQVSAAEGREVQAGKAPNTQLDFRAGPAGSTQRAGRFGVPYARARIDSLGPGECLWDERHGDRDGYPSA
jgi:outer membrane protein TolC